MSCRVYMLALIAFIPVSAWAGDPVAGEADFKKCKACHEIEASDGTILQKGGKIGPNLFGILGRPIGTLDGFRFGEDIVSVGKLGLVWDEERLTDYIQDPPAFLADTLGQRKAKSKMTYRHRAGAEDMAAYLASITNK